MIKIRLTKLNRIKIAAISVLTVVLASIVTPFFLDPTYAETTVTVEDCKIKVTINIAITGAGANDDYAKKVKQAAEKKWNDAHIHGGDCKCELELTVNVVVVDNCNDDKAKNHHCITVASVPAGTFHRSTVTGTASNWHENGASNDNSAPHIPSGTGNWGSNDSDNVIAHEVGHLMGLDDEYTDGYYYFYADAAGTPVSGATFVSKDDFTADKKKEIEDAAPAGSNVVYMTNPDTNTLIWSRPNAGKQNSIMAGIGANAVPMDGHAEDVMGDAKVKCPDECCCGDGKVDKDKNEQCDPKADPNGCPNPDEGCAKNCVCVKITPICGDGVITPPEECDPKATPTGCPAGKTCSGCKCISPPSGGGGGGGTTPTCTDSDGDGYKTEGGDCGPVDCDDGNPSINPGADEVCGDGVDNDCDSLVDEDCPSISVSQTEWNIGPGGALLQYQTVYITNVGGGTLNWTITNDFPVWLGASSFSGSLGPGLQDWVELSANKTVLAPGSYSHTVKINSNGGNRNISVSMEVP